MLHLKELRKERGISILKLASQSGISRRTLEDIERRGDCRISTARAICNALGCKLDDFYTNDEAGD